MKHAHKGWRFHVYFSHLHMDTLLGTLCTLHTCSKMLWIHYMHPNLKSFMSHNKFNGKLYFEFNRRTWNFLPWYSVVISVITVILRHIPSYASCGIHNNRPPQQTIQKLCSREFCRSFAIFPRSFISKRVESPPFIRDTWRAVARVYWWEVYIRCIYVLNYLAVCAQDCKNISRTYAR